MQLGSCNQLQPKTQFSDGDHHDSLRHPVVAAAAFAGAPAAAATYSGKPAVTAAGKRIIARDISWNCGPAACLGTTEDSRPAVLCQGLAKRAGRLTSFVVNGRAFSRGRARQVQRLGQGRRIAQARRSQLDSPAAPARARLRLGRLRTLPRAGPFLSRLRKPPSPPHMGAMLRQYELIEKVRAYDPDADEGLINRAYVFSMKAHGAQVRASGDPYFSHPIEVAGILTDLKLDDETIVTAILHDTIEDTVATHEQIEKLFGANVARLVDGVTKLSKIEAQSENERAAENLRKFLLALSGDIRVLLVKLADRLHNMRTLHHVQVGGEAAPNRQGDDGYLRPAGRADRHVRDHERDADAWRSASSSPTPMPRSPAA